MERVTQWLTSSRFWQNILLLAVGVAVLVGLRYVSKRVEKRGKSSGKAVLNINFAVAAVRYVVIIYLVLVLLQLNGVNVTALVTGLGVAGIIVGFALQDILKDFIMGTNIVWNEFFRAGDVIRFKDITGEVVSFNIRVTRVRDVINGSLHTISNRNIDQVEVLSDWLDMDVPAPYEETGERMRAVCEIMAARVRELSQVTWCEYLGVQEFADSQILYRLRIHCAPEERPVVRRAVNGIIQAVLAEENISVPYSQLDVRCVTK